MSSDDILRRRAVVEERIARASTAAREVEAACKDMLFGDETLSSLDDQGMIVLALNTLVPAAINTPGFDLTLVVDGAGEWGLRLHNVGSSLSVTARRLGAADKKPQPAAAPTWPADPADPDQAPLAPQRTGSVASDLADLLRG